MRGVCSQQLATVDGPSLRDATRMMLRNNNNNLRSNGPSDGLLSRPTPAVLQDDDDGGDDDTENQQQEAVYWERFLQKKTINVLLVESDDCTRRVVSALLRHCMYQVISAENGQQAWNYLEDKQNNIDIVLIEVFMPGVSGISLLSRIMSHNICKNIPVIMMSSNDARNTVFKCLSKGAVDFLVKPIRKNELKNLWQHVWRRCHSSSGSGSESGIQTQKCGKSKGGKESGNNSGSNDSHDNEADMGLNARDDSDNGSGTQAQSSWTKCAVEMDSPQAMSLDQLADPPDSTCAQVIHPKSEICSNRRLPDDFKEKDLEIGGPGNLYIDHQSSPNERPIKATDGRCEYPPKNNSKESMMQNLEDPTVGAADLIGSMAKNMDTQEAARAADTPNLPSKVPEGKDKNKHDKILPSLELSLKRSRSCGDGANTVKDDEQQNVLRQSNLSAFTRYHTSTASNQGGTGLVGSCSPHDNSSEAMKTDSTYNMKSNSDAAPIKQGSNGSSNNNDMGSTTKNVVTKPTTNNRDRVMLPSSAINKANGHTSAFHPVQHWTMVPANAAGGTAKADEVANIAGYPSGDMQCNLMQWYPRPTLHYVQFDGARENGGSGALQCGSSNVFDPPVEGQATNYGVNRSNSGSNNATKGQNGSNTVGASMAGPNANANGNAGRTNLEIANEVIDKSGHAGGGNGSGSGSGNDTYVKRLAAGLTPRQAQLKKYREKKKDRNFGKKVRYQSRKRLADQRPRFRGQFVKQALQDQGEQDGTGER
uniref:Pseudo-response regulator 37 n=1 Tax=Sorghum bicolor TaxID=4558 RepID=A0A059PTM0_SORBI|nr:pseudo-response regulator 37 [Sorghum bicolor]